MTHVGLLLALLAGAALWICMRAHAHPRPPSRMAAHDTVYPFRKAAAAAAAALALLGLSSLPPPPS